MFVAFGAGGLGIAVLLGYLLPNDPSAVREHGQEGRFWAQTREAIRIPALPLSALAYLLFNLAYWGLLGWAPTYLAQDRHVFNVQSQGWLLSAVYVSGFFGLVLFGWLGSTVMVGRRGLLAAIAYFGAAAAMLGASRAESTAGCIVGLSCAAYFLFGSFGPMWGISLDLAPTASRGLVTGWINFCGQVGGFIGPIAIGFLAGRMGSFMGGMLFMVVALACAGGVMGFHAARFRPAAA
jgi:sugar phosphate permease